MNRKLIFISLTSLFLTLLTNAQKLKHELGFFVGPVSIQSDYGERGDFGSTYGNVGIGAGVVYYLSFDETRKRWNDYGSYIKNHFRLKLELSYMSDNFIHRGSYADPNDISLEAIKYRAMEGSTKLFNAGGMMEFNLYEFYQQRIFNPYLSMGILYSSFDPDLKSKLGDINTDPSLIPAVYDDGIFLEKGSTASFVIGGGARYKLNKFDLLFDFRGQRFFSNKVDGLDPKLDQNKFREWLLFFNVGAVFKLN
jgi:hypothetical protein